MAVFHTMPNGEVVPVPDDIVAESNAAQQSFYDNQLARIQMEATDFSPTDSLPAAPAKE